MAFRSISKRDMTMHSSGEMTRRALFALYVLSAVAGLAATGFGLVRHERPFIIGGAIALALSLALHLTRQRWRAAGLADEIRANPFKPERVPKKNDDALV